MLEYTSVIYEDTEKRYKSDIASLQRQLSSSHEGRDYETEIISTRLDQLKQVEQVSGTYYFLSVKQGHGKLLNPLMARLMEMYIYYSILLNR